MARGPSRQLAPTTWWLMAVSAATAAGAIAWAAGAHGLARGAFDGAALVGLMTSLAASVSALRQRRLGVDVIAVAALIGALAVGESFAGAIVGLMVVSGQSLESWAQGRSSRDLTALLRRAPRVAHLVREGGAVEVPVAEVRPGDRLSVAAGEVLCVDGVVEGEAVLDESALTGESRSVVVPAGGPVRSGALNAGAPFTMSASAAESESTYAGIVRLVSAAQGSTPSFVRLADRFAVGFLPLTAVLTGLAGWWGGADRAVAVLVVATPCPLILAAPIAWVAGLSRCARRGVIVKGGAILERLARCTTLVADKTGTLSEGRPAVVEVVVAPGWEVDRVLEEAASLEQASRHVLAAAVVREAHERSLSLVEPLEVSEEAGHGLRGRLGDNAVAVGGLDWLSASQPTVAPPWLDRARRRARAEGASMVGVAHEDRLVGAIVLRDPLRRDAYRLLRGLREEGIERVVVATGDHADVARRAAVRLGVDEVHAGVDPAAKVAIVRAEQARAPVVMVGDGINDAPALAVADVGVALGARGASASSEAADIVVSLDRLDLVGVARGVATRSRRVATQSVVGGMAASLVAMGVAASGHLPAVGGALLQEAIDVAAIANALRALRGPRRAALDAAGQAAAARAGREHGDVIEVVRSLRRAADELDEVGPEGLQTLASQLASRVEAVMVHEGNEERDLFPSLERVMGRSSTWAARAEHRALAGEAQRLNDLAGTLGEEEGVDGDADSARAALRAALYELAAMLEMHTAVEEDSFIHLSEE